MRRTSGTILLLLSMSGCVTIEREPGPGTTGRGPQAFVPPPAAGMQIPSGQPMPAPAAPSLPMPPGGTAIGPPPGGPQGPTPAVATWAPSDQLPERYQRTDAGMTWPNSPVPAPIRYGAQRPVVMTPRPMMMAPAGIPMVVTPPRNRDEEDRATGKVVLASATREVEADEEVPSSKPNEPCAPRPLPPMPVRSQPDRGVDNATAAATERPTGPLMRFVNRKRITLNFEVTDVGASGLSAVEVWYTTDGQEWSKIDAPPQKKSYVVGVDDEGKYGFTLVARNGLGLGHEAPAAGDQPQMWVTVDTTRPVVELIEVTPNVHHKAQTVAIRWRATDKHLGRDPITLSYAERAGGPWHPIAANLPNNGRYDWKLPTGAPARLMVRVEATDLAGNVGRAQTARAMLLDTSRPNVSILTVEPEGR